VHENSMNSKIKLLYVNTNVAQDHDDMEFMAQKLKERI
jgi:hypothetical protein